MTDYPAVRGEKRRVAIFVGFNGAYYLAEIVDKDIRSENAYRFTVFLYADGAGDYLTVTLNVGVRSVIIGSSELIAALYQLLEVGS